ncbi:hypothetical protein N7478_004398 [Penicillium angulare]|uniref:uncharacterized protein n=1 Tax=Penicillium angulare TaxID=116970 RepID=UPI0025423D55|nr:uncharacterized protein N7478_004398 [Penicillium angulare]KAJ5279026.1 hypothetical protein N7478_004398 [Penicillium angulare]
MSGQPTVTEMRLQGVSSSGISGLLQNKKVFLVALFASPLYNAELAPPEMRGLLVALQQLSTTIGIMTAYCIGYGTNYIGGTGDGQSDWAWRTPLIAQVIPAIVLVLGAAFFLPSHMLINKGREEEALKTLASLRNLPEDSIILRYEFLEIKSKVLFQQRSFARRFPHLAESGHSVWRREFVQYTNIFRTKANFKRVAIAGLIVFFQQWSGVDAIIYYASSIFQSLGLTSGTTSLLATGVVGIINVLATIPAILIIDKVGRKPLLIAGYIAMFCSMIIVTVIVAKFQHDWEHHATAGWAAVAFIWIYIANFGYSWGPARWVLISAIFIWFYVPETKNKALEEMDVVFGSVTASEDRDILAEVREELGLSLLLDGGGSKSISEDNQKEGISAGHLESA